MSQATQAAGLRAGAASVDITPTVPVRQDGYANRVELSQGTHDPLKTRALAMEHNGRRLVLVSADILGYYGGTAQAYSDAICRAHNLRPGELWLTAVHTHGGPQIGLDAQRLHPSNFAYTRWLQDQLVTLVGQALSKMVPATISVGVGSSPVGSYRRKKVVDAAGNSRLWLGRNPDILTDRHVQVLKVDRADGSGTLACNFAYATHSTSMGWKNLQITGDVHGLAEQFIEQHLSDGMIAPGFAGASGDIDPWYRVLGEFQTTSGWVPEAVLMGTMLGEEVVHVYRESCVTVPAAPFASQMQMLALPPKAPSIAPERAQLAVTVARVGEVAFVGLGGEVFNEIGQAIKAASPFAHTFIITHCNGAAGYLPTAASYPEGGYEVESTPFAPDAAEKVVATATELLRSL